MVELYLPSPIRLHGMIVNQLILGATIICILATYM
jgi:hypothetical protein